MDRYGHDLRLPVGMEPKPEPSWWDKIAAMWRPEATASDQPKKNNISGPNPNPMYIDPDKAAAFVKGFNR